MATRRKLMEAEVVRLTSLKEKLDRDWRRIPLLASFILTAIPAYQLWGGWAATYAVLFTPCLMISATYLIGVRRAETRQALSDLERSIEKRKRLEA